MGLRRNRTKAYARGDLEIFDLLGQPVWIFDITEKAMWWANESALELWNADSLDSLLNRNFADDMSEATEQRLSEYYCKFQQGGTVHDQWTYFPEGRGATTVQVTLSGIHVIDDSTGTSRLMMLNEGLISSPIQEAVEQESLRGVEMLRHLPVAVCQFDLQGKLMYQNPESSELFGLAADPNQEDSLCSFSSRFVDHQVGKRAMEQVLQGKDYCVEAQQKTKRDGLRWFSLSLRLSKDPVTSQPVVLYSARDISEVIHAKKEADKANNEKSEFLAVMAHEIRTPLHQVSGFLELLSLTQMKDTQREYVRLMQSSSHVLMAVINDLLDYTKMEAGKLQLEKIPFEVKGVMEGCRQIILPKATEKSLTLSCHWPLGMPVKLLGDAPRLRQIILNLLANACKFTQTGGITLAVTHVTPLPAATSSNGGARIRFQVEDTGIGISKQDRSQIFQKYQQANATIARRFGGTGLGLCISKSLVEAMGGTIELESELGKGTKVSFEIPFEAVVDHPSPVAPPKAPIKVESAHSLRVLVVEDNKLNQKVVKAMLERLGHNVTLADDGALGVQSVEDNTGNPFDVILMDVQMPVMDGIEATKALRSKGYCERSLPIVGLTASYQPAERQYYRDCGMNDCVGKPAKLQILGKVLSNLQKLKKGTGQCSTFCGGDDSNHHHPNSRTCSEKNVYSSEKNGDALTHHLMHDLHVQRKPTARTA